MTTHSLHLPTALERHLSSSRHAGLPGVGTFIETGADLVTPQALGELRTHYTELHTRIANLGDSERLRSRLELLAAFFLDTAHQEPASPRARREVAFALLYFLRNADRIPDDVPQIGLLDDAVIIQFVLQRQAASIARWARRRGWDLPAEAA